MILATFSTFHSWTNRLWLTFADGQSSQGALPKPHHPTIILSVSQARRWKEEALEMKCNHVGPMSLRWTGCRMILATFSTFHSWTNLLRLTFADGQSSQGALPKPHHPTIILSVSQARRWKDTFSFSSSQMEGGSS
ncbi:hypothetical protein M758_4G122000 [Ceratodon purpureus]|nr:hypothetical protein M758_4G122000 [Ceratodon purpureus]